MKMGKEKKLVAMISTEGKEPDEIKEAAMEAFNDFNSAKDGHKKQELDKKELTNNNESAFNALLKSLGGAKEE